MKIGKCNEDSEIIGSFGIGERKEKGRKTSQPIRLKKMILYVLCGRLQFVIFLTITRAATVSDPSH